MSAEILLVNMPWAAVDSPSIQLGTIAALLRRAGIESKAYYLNLGFWAHLEERLRLPQGDVLEVLRVIANALYNTRVGEWIFSLPPLVPSDLARDEEFLELLDREIASLADPKDRRAARSLEPIRALVQRIRPLAAEFVEHWADELTLCSPRAVGFTLTFQQTIPSLLLAQAIKERNPDVRVVLGGACTEGPMGPALLRGFPFVDVVVQGNATRVVPDLAHRLVTGSPLDGLCGVLHRLGETIAGSPGATEPFPLDQVPQPIYDEYFDQLPASRDAAPLRAYLPIESSRGCWWGEKHRCTFCGISDEEIPFRAKSSARIHDEIRSLAAKHRRLDFLAVDYILHPRTARELLPRLVGDGLDYRLFYSAKANLSRDDLALFRSAGVTAFQPGIESLSTAILRIMNKGVTAIENIRLLRWCAEIGLTPQWNILFGIPGEEPEEYRRMADVSCALVHLPAPSLIRLEVQRFSRYHQDPEGHGLRILGAAAAYRYIYPLEEPLLRDVAYELEYEYVAHPDPELYVRPLAAVIEAWAFGRSSLNMRKGPGFLLIRDRRATRQPADYRLDELESTLYLACDAGATPAQAHAALSDDRQREVSVTEVRQLFDGLVAEQLLYDEDGRYLSLAVGRRM